jgi:hypothetical protein
MSTPLTNEAFNATMGMMFGGIKTSIAKALTDSAIADKMNVEATTDVAAAILALAATIGQASSGGINATTSIETIRNAIDENFRHFRKKKP